MDSKENVIEVFKTEVINGETIEHYYIYDTEEQKKNSKNIEVIDKKIINGEIVEYYYI